MAQNLQKFQSLMKIQNVKIIDNIDILLIKQTYSDLKLLASGKIQQQLRICSLSDYIRVCCVRR